MTDKDATIIYTLTDEAPALATYSLLPIVEKFAAAAGVNVETRDISLSGRILANFPEELTDEQKVPDALTELGELAKTPAANIIKLPNISASIPQLNAAIEELQGQGYKLPEYPEEVRTKADKALRKRFAKVLGSAVNPVLREGNSDRRVAPPVKAYARANPHSMGAWSSDSKTRVAHMFAGDFYGSEKSTVVEKDTAIRILLTEPNGKTQVLKAETPLLAGEVIDSAVMRRSALREFFARETENALSEGVLLSLHLKATMMKVSDPIMFGHAVSIYYASALEKHAETLERIGVDLNNGIGDVYANLDELPDTLQRRIRDDLQAVYSLRPPLAMVDSDRGITNLHVPSDIIIDASMPAALRSSGQMWGPDGKLRDTVAMIPDRSYAGIYQAVIEDCQEHGAFDVTTMGNVSNVGLMAQKAQEYGSHDKTFEMTSAGEMRIVDMKGHTLLRHPVERGDIWRMCQTKDLPIRDWVKLAVSRARATGAPAIFWLDDERAHDLQLIAKVRQYLNDHDLKGLTIDIMAPVEAMRYTLKRVRAGEDTISVTGNVLRDYLTDLFPILELGTSAKMLSIVPLLAGGGLYETGAGGSAPKHVQQFNKEGHLRWDSLGEFLALAVSLEDLAEKTGNAQAAVLAAALTRANGLFLTNNKAPSRKVNELDNRGSHFYLCLYWAQALAEQSDDDALRAHFAPIAAQLAEQEATIVSELNEAQGEPVDIGGYYHPDPALAAAAMRPSKTFNGILDGLTQTPSSAAA